MSHTSTTKFTLATLILAFSFSEPVFAQTTGAPALGSQLAAMPVPSPSSVVAPSGGQNPFLGGVASGKATPEVLALSLNAAIDRGLRYNLGVLTSEQNTRSARAAQIRSLSSLLPNLTTSTSESAEQINLRALGFSGFPGIPVIVGPFGVFDTRAYLSQTLLDFNALRKEQEGRENLVAARHSYQNSRDIVVLVVASLYLQAIAGSSRIDAAEAQVKTAQALYNLAIDLKTAGIVPGIEVLRAQVELQAQQQRLIFFRNQFDKQKLSLARAIGLPIEQQFRLASQIPYTPQPPITVEEALQRAYRDRADYKSAQALVRAAESARQAAFAERLPSLSFDGNYGTIGPRIDNSHGTFTVAASLRIPVFQGGKVRADVLQASAQLQQRKDDLEDLRSRIDYEIRTAFLDLRAAGEQVKVATSSVTLANQQLEQARDRFKAGVANNIEVVQAQQAVATADENYISSLYSYNVAKASLARAVGAAEKASKEFLGVH
jgi:outer membrane protein TolC